MARSRRRSMRGPVDGIHRPNAEHPVLCVDPE